MKKKIIIGTHGRFGEEIVESARMIVGDMENIVAFSLLPGMSPEELTKQIAEKIEPNTEYICLVDLFGGTPCVALSSMTRDHKMIVVTGLNLAMLLEVYMALEDSSLTELVETAINTLQNSVKVIPDIKQK